MKGGRQATRILSPIYGFREDEPMTDPTGHLLDEYLSITPFIAAWVTFLPYGLLGDLPSAFLLRSFL